MTASDHLSPEQFFHGTTAKLKPGDMMTTEGADTYGRYERISKGYLHFTDEEDHARDYAHARAKDYGKGAPRVYQVEPTGEHESDPGSAYPVRRTAAPMKVLREVPKPENWEPTNYE